MNVPLLPITVEVRWRRLPPVTLRGLTIGVVVAGLVFALIAHVRRTNQAHQYHREQASLAYQARMRTGLPPSPLELWHGSMASQYQAALMRADLPAFVVFMTAVTLMGVAILGRALDWSARRLGFPEAGEPTNMQAINQGIQYHSTEEPRP